MDFRGGRFVVISSNTIKLSGSLWIVNFSADLHVCSNILLPRLMNSLGQGRNFGLKSGVPIQEETNIKIGRNVPSTSNYGERRHVVSSRSGVRGTVNPRPKIVLVYNLIHADRLY